MILYDPSLNAVHKDYGIMIPISPGRAGRIMQFLAEPGLLSVPPLGPVLDTAGALRFLDAAASGCAGDSIGGTADTGPVPPALTRADLERVHSKEFIAGLYEEGPEGPGGLLKALLTAWELIDSQGRPHRYEPERAVKPLPDLFRTMLAQTGGTYLAARLALAAHPAEFSSEVSAGEAGFCFYLGGGSHHARYDTGAGFCLLNDIVIAARKIQTAVAPGQKRAALIWVVDVDAHKGCGTAELVRLARERGELSPLGQSPGPEQASQILNLSIHMGRGWPLDGETLASAQSGRAPLIPADVEIPIEAGEESFYIQKLEAGLKELETLSGAAKPDLVIVVDGADPYEHDGLPSGGLLRLTLDQCLARDMLIYRYLRERRIPSAWIMAGGYGDRAWEPPAYFLRQIGAR